MQKFLFSTLFLLSMISSARAGITLDYSQDTNNFFGNSTAKAALEAAVADINAVLNLNLGAITNDIAMGTFGSTTASIDFSYGYTNPSTGLGETIANTVLAANEFKIFVGAQSLGGSTLGQGGHGGFGLQLSIGGIPAEAQGAMDAAIAADQHRRGDGPIMGNLSGTAFSGGAFASDYSIDVGPTIGNLWFDMDTNNDNVLDDAATLASNWHFDHTTAVEAGKSDLYSVALHETLHAIGFGTSDTWESLVSGGTEWLGADVISLNGTGEAIIDSESGAHFASGLMSTLFLDPSISQEVVMDPSITIGTRKYLTQLDVAVLRDIGYSTVVAVPEPSTLIALAILGGGAIVVNRRKASRHSA